MPVSGKINMKITNIRKVKVKHITIVISINTLSQTKKRSGGVNSISPKFRIKLTIFMRQTTSPVKTRDISVTYKNNIVVCCV
jgi:hypothetical protein